MLLSVSKSGQVYVLLKVGTGLFLFLCFLGFFFRGVEEVEHLPSMDLCPPNQTKPKPKELATERVKAISVAHHLGYIFQ